MAGLLLPSLFHHCASVSEDVTMKRCENTEQRENASLHDSRQTGDRRQKTRLKRRSVPNEAAKLSSEGHTFYLPLENATTAVQIQRTRRRERTGRIRPKATIPMHTYPLTQRRLCTRPGRDVSTQPHTNEHKNTFADAGPLPPRRRSSHDRYELSPSFPYREHVCTVSPFARWTFAAHRLCGVCHKTAP